MVFVTGYFAEFVAFLKIGEGFVVQVASGQVLQIAGIAELVNFGVLNSGGMLRPPIYGPTAW